MRREKANFPKNRSREETAQKRVAMMMRFAASSSSSSSFFSFPRKSEKTRGRRRPRRVSSSSSTSSSGRRWITPKPPPPASASSSSSSSRDDDDDEDEEKERRTMKTKKRKDSEIDRALISIFASRLAQFLNEEEEELEEEKGRRTTSDDDDDGKINFERDVARRCVRAVAKSSSEEEQRMFGLAIIESFIPTGAAKAFGWFLRLFPEWFARRHAAFVTPLLLPWLVGDAEVNDVPEEYAVEESGAPANAFEALFAPGKKSQKSGYKQGVLVKRCRVLEESGCVSVCKNVCKIPTETFFTEKVGLPVTLIPNYETLECQFCYGRVADGSEGEEAGGCYVGCSASASKRCGGAVESSGSSSCDSLIKSDGSD